MSRATEVLGLLTAATLLLVVCLLLAGWTRWRAQAPLGLVG